MNRHHPAIAFYLNPLVGIVHCGSIGCIDIASFFQPDPLDSNRVAIVRVVW